MYGMGEVTTTIPFGWFFKKGQLKLKDSRNIHSSSLLDKLF